MTEHRKRVRRAPAGPRVEVIPLEDAARIVTLTDPSSVEAARGAFARIDPPANTEPELVEAWRAQAAAVALAVRVLPGRRDAAVPAADARPAVDRGADVRAEAVEIGRERGGEELAGAVEALFG